MKSAPEVVGVVTWAQGAKWNDEVCKRSCGDAAAAAAAFDSGEIHGAVNGRSQGCEKDWARAGWYGLAVTPEAVGGAIENRGRHEVRRVQGPVPITGVHFEKLVAS